MLKLSHTLAFAVGAAFMACAGAAAPALAAPTDRAITVVLPTEPESLDSCDSQTAVNANVVKDNVYESLTKVSPADGSVIPLLAESWENEGNVWRFHLRQGVKFHDGSDFDAETAAANVIRSQAGTEFYSGKLACSNSQQFVAKVEAKAVDKYTLELSTEQPDPIMPLRMTYIEMGSKATQEQTDKITHPVGTGPYQFVERVQGQSVKLTRFDGYWGEIPDVKEVTYVYRTEAAVRASMIETGEAQLATAIRSEDATGDDRTVAYKDNRIFLIRVMTDKPPFNDVRVRRAVAHAIDREGITQALMGITGAPWFQMLGPQVNGFIPDFDNSQMSYDPEKSRQLLAEAKADGVPVETEFLIISRPDQLPNQTEVVQAIAQNLEEVGFKLQLLNLEGSAWLKYLRGPFPADQPATLHMVSHDNTSGDASFSYPRYIACGGVVSAHCNPKIDELLKQADVAEGEERARLYQEASRILLSEDVAMIGVAEQARLIRLGEGIKYEANPMTGIIIRIADIKVTE
jgi:peptide/nickel transport system substrate-binding protein